MLTALLEIFWKMARLAPACGAGIVLMGLCLFMYANTNLVKAEDFNTFQNGMEKNFALLMNRMSVSDADQVVRDIQGQVRAKEKEIDDMRMVLTTLEPRTDPYKTISARIFSLQQDLNDLNLRLSESLVALQGSRQLLVQAYSQ